MKALLFYREKCPHCPPVKEYMAKHYSNIDVEPVNCDTEKGMEMARDRWVMSTPTVVMLDDDNGEVWRARTVDELGLHADMEE